jgi:squalene-associated FAD-dependent desaturase
MAHVGARLSGVRVAVVGGGWAGCAAAGSLAAAGARVVLFEAAGELGGRSRRVALELGGAVHALDNGQHLMVGAYTATARLLAAIGVDLDRVVERRPFELGYPDGFQLRAARLPAPWHLAAALLRARGLGWHERAALVRLLRGLRARGWRVGEDRAAAGWLAEHEQGTALVNRVWRPLALAVLNTPLAEASAQLFANVLRDTFGATGAASELWLPRTDLSALLPEAVERFVGTRGGAVRRRARVEAVTADGAGYRIALAGGASTGDEAFDRVVYAAPPAQLARVAGALSAALQAPLALIERFAYEPICTVYLKYPPEAALERGFSALTDDPARAVYGQWVFDRGAFDSAQRGVFAVIVSAHGPHEAEPLPALAAAIARQLTDVLGLPAPIDARVIVEKRATLAARPRLQRPGNTTALPGFALAGDWTDSDYPSTLEAAVRSGVAAAALLGA